MPTIRTIAVTVIIFAVTALGGCASQQSPSKSSQLEVVRPTSQMIEAIGGGKNPAVQASIRGAGCPREQDGKLFRFAQKALGEEDIFMLTLCRLEPVGPALEPHPLDWTASDRCAYGVACRWGKLTADGTPVQERAWTNLIFHKICSKAGESVKVFTYSTAMGGHVHTFKVMEDGVLNIKAFEKERGRIKILNPTFSETKGDGRLIIAASRCLVTKETGLEWRTRIDGRNLCYPSGGDPNYTRAGGWGNPGELYRSLQKKHWTVLFDVACPRKQASNSKGGLSTIVADVVNNYYFGGVRAQVARTTTLSIFKQLKLFSTNSNTSYG